MLMPSSIGLVRATDLRKHYQHEARYRGPVCRHQVVTAIGSYSPPGTSGIWRLPTCDSPMIPGSSHSH